MSLGTGLMRIRTILQAALFSVLPARWARRQLAKNKPKRNRAKNTRLLIDVSVSIRQNLNTGIQRVVRAWTSHLAEMPLPGITVLPIRATARGGYKYAGPCFGTTPNPETFGRKVKGQAGDLFFGVDLAAHLVWRNQAQFLRWKQDGVRIVFMVHDLLPLLHPEWFNPRTGRHFRRWIKVLARYADGILCSTEAVAADVRAWFAAHDGVLDPAIEFYVVPLGADINASLPTLGEDKTEGRQMQALTGHNFVLVVGTIEPRKGHACTLAAFEAHWRHGGSTALVLVGRPGWKTEALQATLTCHPERNRRLFWFNDASDALLGALYHQATGVLVPSLGEGYGLPLVEALHYQKPVLARSLPVFREIAGDRVTYFEEDGPEALARILEQWLEQSPPQPVAQIPRSWRDSTKQLAALLLAERSAESNG